MNKPIIYIHLSIVNSLIVTSLQLLITTHLLLYYSINFDVAS